MSIDKALKHRLRLYAKRLLFPGLDLHTRSRLRFLPSFFLKGRIDTLDAGCGNGALAYAAYRLGNNVLGVNSDAEEISRCRDFFSWLKTDPQRIRFEVCNLYDLPKLKRRFDQIICTEVLEHIRGDDVVIRYFYDMLRPNGILHLCCPNALHPEHNLGRTDDKEDGRHVRDGYTLEIYEKLLGPTGFIITESAGVGSPFLVWIDNIIREIRTQRGDAAALPLFIATHPFQIMFDYLNPNMPYSIYIKAVKAR